MPSSDDLTNVRDNMLTRMAMATPGGPLFRTNPPPDLPKLVADDCRFDEGQAFATSRKGLATHSALMRVLGGWAIEIRRQLDQGHTVVLSAAGKEIARFEP